MKNNKGITIIALVITVIVLIILAGISISAFMGDNSMIHRASEADEATRKSNAYEKLETKVAASYNRIGEPDLKKLEENLKSIPGIEGIPSPFPENYFNYITVAVDGYEMSILNSNGKMYVIFGLPAV